MCNVQVTIKSPKNIQWDNNWKVILGYRKVEKYNKLKILSIFALLPWIRKPATQTMTKVEGYHITYPSALQMKLCVFACCSATEQQYWQVLCKAVLYGHKFVQTKRNILQSADPLHLVENV